MNATGYAGADPCCKNLTDMSLTKLTTLGALKASDINPAVSKEELKGDLLKKLRRVKKKCSEAFAHSYDRHTGYRASDPFAPQHPVTRLACRAKTGWRA